MAAEVCPANTHHQVVGIEVARGSHELSPGIDGLLLVRDGCSSALSHGSAQIADS